MGVEKLLPSSQNAKASRRLMIEKMRNLQTKYVLSADAGFATCMATNGYSCINRCVVLKNVGKHRADGNVQLCDNCRGIALRRAWILEDAPKKGLLLPGLIHVNIDWLTSSCPMNYVQGFCLCLAQ